MRCEVTRLAHRVISWRRSNSVAFGAKRTLGEPRLQKVHAVRTVILYSLLFSQIEFVGLLFINEINGAKFEGATTKSKRASVLETWRFQNFNDLNEFGAGEGNRTLV